MAHAAHANNTIHIVAPRDGHDHTQTIIFLHGRDSTASEFAEEFFESQASDDRTLLDIFPGTRWVFPTAKMRNSARFETPMSQWFDIWSVENPMERSQIQLDGLRESVEEILAIVQRESTLIAPDRIILGGISQGCATAIHALMYGDVQLSGFIGLSSWLPFEPGTATVPGYESWHVAGDQLRYSRKLLDSSRSTTTTTDPAIAKAVSSLKTPVFLSHSQDDEVVLIANGKKLSDTLQKLGMSVFSKQYQDGGHWVNEPQGVDDLASFIHLVGAGSTTMSMN